MGTKSSKDYRDGTAEGDKFYPKHFIHSNKKAALYLARLTVVVEKATLPLTIGLSS
jgi:hypothetical protein